MSATLFVTFLFAVLLGLLPPGQQPATGVVCRPAVAERSSPTRTATTAFYDQGRDSIAALHPRHRLLAERRSGTIGRVEYSLIAYQPEMTAPVSISILAVDWEARRAWSIETSCRPGDWAGGLVDAIATAGALPGQSKPVAGAPLIEAVRATIARDIDPMLPPVSFEAWLAGVVGAQARMQWEVNDCGEQTGDPARDRGRDFPTCVQVRAELAGTRAVILLVSAGSQQKQPAGVPAYHFGVLMSDGRQQEIRRLTDLASIIKAQ
jgi:hypothetical protein